MTPDPAGMAAADPSNPQSWNRYAYVMNNPLGYVDPWAYSRPATIIQTHIASTRERAPVVRGKSCRAGCA